MREGRRTVSRKHGGLSRRELLRLIPAAALGATGALGPARLPAASPAPRRGGTFKIPVTANVTPWPPIGLIQNLMVNKSLFNTLSPYQT